MSSSEAAAHANVHGLFILKDFGKGQEVDFIDPDQKWNDPLPDLTLQSGTRVREGGVREGRKREGGEKGTEARRDGGEGGGRMSREGEY